MIKKTISLILALLISGAFLIPMTVFADETPTYDRPGTGRLHGYNNLAGSSGDDTSNGQYGGLIFVNGNQSYRSYYPWLYAAPLTSATSTVDYVIKIRNANYNMNAADYYIFSPYGATSASFSSSASNGMNMTFIPSSASTVTIETTPPIILINNNTCGFSVQYGGSTNSLRINPYMFPEGYWIHIKFSDTETFTANSYCCVSVTYDFSICPSAETPEPEPEPSPSGNISPWVIAIALLAVGVCIFCLFIL